MKLYVMRPVMTPVPIIWQARTGTGLRPAKRKTPKRRIRRKSSLFDSYYEALRTLVEIDSVLETIERSMPSKDDLLHETGKSVRFIRHIPLPTLPETRTEKGDD